MKKILLLLLSFFLVPFAYADNYPDSYESGYIGIFGGALGTDAGFRSQTTSAGGNSITPVSASFPKKNTISGGIDLGFGATMGVWYLGVDLSTQPIPVNLTLNRIVPSTGASITDKTTITDYGNLDLLPGVYLGHSVLIYLRLGGGLGQVSLKQTNNAVGITAFNDSNTDGLGRAGVGFDVAITNALSVGADYVYSQYGSSTTSGVSPVDGLQTSLTVTKPKQNFVGLHLHYNFGGPNNQSA